MDHSSLPSTQSTVIEKVVAFVDERVGLKQLQAKMLNEPVPGGSRWAYVFGSILLFIFIMLVMAGIVIYYTMSGESKDAFWGPIQRFLTGENIGALQTARYAVLILFPLLVGWQTYGSTAVSDAPPAENRTIHPAPPGEYTGLSNPVAKTPENIMRESLRADRALTLC